MHTPVLDKTRKPTRTRDTDHPTERAPGCDQGERIITAVTALSEEAFLKFWDNPKDADYDHL